MPEFIGGRAQDVPELMTALNNCSNRLRISDTHNVDPVLQATCAAFGFIFILPLADGNGRLHRFLIDYVLPERDYIRRARFSCIERDARPD
ncbi:Fic family protein [uncultured Ruegeria sp.]|uniref:Fic family protein n=1 Tax=uncultured Ruegeria sp. TaxID=259304 RepID=UPI00261641E0|nr:Fic family protein [uncultured Ruegeria sp.]